jgi:hypothetical protein
MPPKTKKPSEQLKRAAADLDDALNDSPVKKKKSKSSLNTSTVAVPDPVLPMPEVTIPDPEFIDKFEPEPALHLTKAQLSINYTVDKINYYTDLLTVFDNNLDDSAINLAACTSTKIEKWGAHRERLQKSMDVLLMVAPKKRAGTLMSTQAAEGFILSSGKPSSSLFQFEVSLSYPALVWDFTFWCLYAYASSSPESYLPLLRLICPLISAYLPPSASHTLLGSTRDC